MIAQPFGQRAHVMLRAADMVAGLVVARLGQGAKGHDRRILRSNDLPALADHLTCALLDEALEFPVMPFQFAPRLRKLQMIADPRQDNRRRDTLVQKVLGAEVQPEFLVDRIFQPGQEDHRNIARQRIGLQFAADLESIHLRHDHIEQNDIDRQATHQIKRLRTAGGKTDVIFFIQDIGQPFDVGQHIVDDQHMKAPCRVHSLSSP